MFWCKKPQKADVSYVGKPGMTCSCEKAVEEYITHRGPPDRVTLLSCERPWHEGAFDNAFMFEKEESEYFKTFVLDGFSCSSSGSAGEALSRIISLLEWHNVESFREINIPREIMIRIHKQDVTVDDIEAIETSPSRGNPRRHRWENHAMPVNPWKGRDVFLPMSLLDDRLVESGKAIIEDPDASETVVREGFRLLEHILKSRVEGYSEAAGLDAVKLIDFCFDKDKGALIWPGVKPGVTDGRRQLFRGAFQAIRNPFSHTVPDHDFARDIRHFLLLNELFTLEKQSITRMEHAARVLVKVARENEISPKINS